VARVPDASVVLEARGLRPADRSRPGDIVALDFFADGRHLVIDAVMTTMYKNTVMEKVAMVPGYAAKQTEDRKFLADKTSRQPFFAVNGGPHILVPFAVYASRMAAGWEPMHTPSCAPSQQHRSQREGHRPLRRG